MIHISKEQLPHVEYLLQQAIQGHHVLFDLDTLRSAFQDPSPPSVEEAYAVEHHIEALMAEVSLTKQKAYLEKLDPSTFRKVVRTYFNIVENTLIEKKTGRLH